MKKRLKTIVTLMMTFALLCSHTLAYAGKSECPYPNSRGHNYNSYVYLANERLEYFEDIPDGRPLPTYSYAVYYADKYGVCICGDCKYLDHVFTRKVKCRINYD